MLGANAAGYAFYDALGAGRRPEIAFRAIAGEAFRRLATGCGGRGRDAGADAGRRPRGMVGSRLDDDRRGPGMDTP
jgi:hypothetical protein